MLVSVQSHTAVLPHFCHWIAASLCSLQIWKLSLQVCFYHPIFSNSPPENCFYLDNLCPSDESCIPKILPFPGPEVCQVSSARGYSQPWQKGQWEVCVCHITWTCYISETFMLYFLWKNFIFSFSCKRLVLANSMVWSAVFHTGPVLVLEMYQKRTVKELDDLEWISVTARLGQMVIKLPKLFG